MTSRFLLTLVCFLMVLPAALPARAATPSGAVYITTLPSGADIWIDGTYVGRAPVLVDALATGRHALTITKTGWVVQEVSVNVAPGETAMSSTHLAAGPRAMASGASGSLEIRDVPPGAQVSLDGIVVHSQPGKNLPMEAGPHRLTLTTKRGTTTRVVTVVPDTTTDVVLREPAANQAPAAVVAPAADYLPTDNFSVEGNKVVVHFAGHVVVGYIGMPEFRIDGATVGYNGAPQSIGGKLYLPLALLQRLTSDEADGK
jgi:PEGA domain